MVRHHQFQKCPPRGQNFFETGYDFQPRFNRAHESRRKHPGASVYNTEAAHSDRRFILQMAQRRNRNALHSCGVEHRSAFGHSHGSAVDCQFNHSRRCSRGGHKD